MKKKKLNFLLLLGESLVIFLPVIWIIFDSDIYDPSGFVFFPVYWFIGWIILSLYLHLYEQNRFSETKNNLISSAAALLMSCVLFIVKNLFRFYKINKLQQWHRSVSMFQIFASDWQRNNKWYIFSAVVYENCFFLINKFERQLYSFRRKIHFLFGRDDRFIKVIYDNSCFGKHGFIIRDACARISHNDHLFVNGRIYAREPDIYKSGEFMVICVLMDNSGRTLCLFQDPILKNLNNHQTEIISIHVCKLSRYVNPLKVAQAVLNIQYSP